MPNVIFKPRPMADPYAGKAGELIGELFDTIGQIHVLRQQRNQSNAILDIIKSPMFVNDEQRRIAILNVARNGGDVLRNMIARQYVADALVPEHERKLRELRLETEKARASNYRRLSGSGNLLELQRLWNFYDEIYQNAETEEEAEQALQKRNEIGKQALSLTQGNQSSQVLQNLADQWLTPSGDGMPSGAVVGQGMNVPIQKAAIEGKGLVSGLRNWLTPQPGETAPISSMYRAKRGMPPITQKPTTTAKFTPEGFVAPKTQPSPFKSPTDKVIAQSIKTGKAPSGLEEIWEQLTEEERQTALIAMSQGKKTEQIVTYFKAQL